MDSEGAVGASHKAPPARGKKKRKRRMRARPGRSPVRPKAISAVVMEANLLAMYQLRLYEKIRAIYRTEQFEYGAVVRLAQAHPLRPGDLIVAGMQVFNGSPWPQYSYCS